MSDTDQPVVAESDTWWSCVCGGSNMPSFKLCYACDRPRPVATLPACLCGLDTNPVVSPRMDIHCPKHDAPEAVGEPSDEEFNPWYENYEKALVAEVSSSTPADEETAREIVRQWASDKTVNMLTRFSADDNFVTRPLINSISTALTEARRAGTPTTEARERAQKIVDEWGGDILPVPTKDYDRSRHGLIDRIASALSFTPSDGVAQRARAAALDEAANLLQAASWLAEIPVKDDEQRLAKLFQKAADAIRALKHFTTDVEQGTCTWACEPNPDIEMWETDCGNAFQFEVGGPTENKMQFCCYCGKRLAERVAEEREEGEGDE